ncbi:MAG TPA: hypothetical protein VN256_08170 [Pyrinomonadaceae bacterium]|nr:hypothetical protein [Pyrinomonadaceae bacterium]
MSVEVSKNIRKLFNLDKQIIFATAKSLTEVAKESQTNVIAEIPDTFTTRNNWYLPSNKFGVKVKAARKNDLTAELKSAADWLVRHEQAGVKTPEGSHLAVPTANVRRTKRQIIARSQRPRNLKRAFVIQTSSGPVLFQRKNKRQIVALYNLEPRVKIRKQSTVVEPTKLTVQQRFDPIFERNLAEAVKTAKVE